MAIIYDLKTTFYCNNNCIHCVVKPYHNSLSEEEKHLSYKDIVEKINENISNETQQIVLTGGEITTRKDFMYIVRYIKEKYPHLSINIQTNGRLLKKHLAELATLDNISYTIAVHSHDEETHNLITNSKNPNGNPYMETLDTLKEVLKYDNIRDNTRLEVVLSKYNYFTLKEIIEFYYNLGFKSIGVSYPHLDGYLTFNPEEIKNISFPVDLLREPVHELFEFLKTTKDFTFSTESIPLCLFYDTNNKLYTEIPDNIYYEAVSIDKETTINFPNADIEEFHYTDCYKQGSICNKCRFQSNCIGVWSDSLEVWGEKMLNPISY